jgi:AmpE protein
MNFIVLIIALLVERVLGEHAGLRDARWYRAYIERLHGWIGTRSFWSGPLGVLLVVGLPTAATGIVYVLLGSAFLSLLAMLFSVAVLWFCLGPHDLDADVHAWIEAVESGDTDRAAELSSSLVGDTGGRISDGILLQFNQRTFAVLFWFALLGPLGAVLYRTTVFARSHGLGTDDPGFSGAATRLQGILDWVPARMIALGFALAGSFEEAVTDWKAYYDHKAAEFWVMNGDVIVAAGRGALRFGNGEDVDSGKSDPAEARSALALTLRTLILWVALFGLVTIGGFAF